jgi:hypothetical protein
METIDVAHQIEFYTLIADISILVPFFLIELFILLRQNKSLESLFVLTIILYPFTFALKLARNSTSDPRKFEAELSLGSHCLGIAVSAFQNLTSLTISYYIFCVRSVKILVTSRTH